MLGTIFNIQRYCVHDGPGIRTSVFLKGCPLKCWWCHNPEGISSRPEIVFWENGRCIGCGECQAVCPQQAVSRRDGAVVIERQRCDLCGKCTAACPTEALEMVGRRVSLEELGRQLIKDQVFYEQSGGGVTFTGGEPFAQPEFLRRMLTWAKGEGISTTVDTSGYASPDIVLAASKEVDLFLFDLKHMDDSRHKELTGVSNQVILQNLRELAARGQEIWLRVPLIPGLNDGENLHRTGELAASLGLKRVHLLPYHQLAGDKYQRLGQASRMEGVRPPSPEEQEEAVARLESFGLQIIVGG